MTVRTHDIITCLEQTVKGTEAEMSDAIRRANRYRHNMEVTWQELFDMVAEGKAHHDSAPQTKPTPTQPEEQKTDVGDGIRAHDADGHFSSDNKATPKVNEAYRDGKTPKKVGSGKRRDF